ncbi:MAG: iron chelate uptake ABC transporter family permease subunit [Phycisphaerales bacterium]|nr:iron chelate uptake ABC transporter family permease subunit [Phycisphaerales bacterium]
MSHLPLVLASDQGTWWPAFERALLLRDANTLWVVLGVLSLGLASGTVGAFLVLRRRALTSDAISHATLPGIAVAFMVMVAFGLAGKSLLGLLLGAYVAGLLAMVAIVLIQRTTRLKDDAAIGIVLSVFFGFGICLLSLVQQMPDGNAAGLERFIFGKAATMLPGDTRLIGFTSLGVILLVIVFFKELAVLCFDESWAAARGWPVLALDFLLTGLVALVTVLAIQSVGLVLAIALLIIPPSTALLWSHRLPVVVIASALIGGFSAWLGAMLSASVARMPTGPVIVLVCAALFFVSLFIGRRGVVPRWLSRRTLSRRVDRQHVLRACWECIETTGREEVAISDLHSMRSWTTGELATLVTRCVRRGSLVRVDSASLKLTEAGRERAHRVVRNHRLWEAYLIHHADIAPSHVDRDADAIEHVLDEDLIVQLEHLLGAAAGEVPSSPHALGGSGGAA